MWLARENNGVALDTDTPHDSVAAAPGLATAGEVPGAMRSVISVYINMTYGHGVGPDTGPVRGAAHMYGDWVDLSAGRRLLKLENGADPIDISVTMSACGPPWRE